MLRALQGLRPHMLALCPLEKAFGDAVANQVSFKLSEGANSLNTYRPFL